MRSSLVSQFNAYMDYCAHTKALRSPTLKGYRDTFGRFSSLMPEVKEVAQISFETIDTFFVRLQERAEAVGHGHKSVGLRASTLRTYGTRLHAFFDWLIARGEIQTNPVIKGHLPKPVYEDKRALERDEIEKILSAIVQSSVSRFQLKRDLAMVHVLLFAGLRKTELLSLRVCDVDLNKRVLVVNGSTSKSKVTRKLPLSVTTLMHIEDYLQERRERRMTNERLWASTRSDTALTPHGIKHWVKSLQKRSGVKFHLHRFRHTFACMLGRNNVSAIKIQKLMGHTDLRMTQSYLRSLGVEDVRDAIGFLSMDSL